MVVICFGLKGIGIIGNTNMAGDMFSLCEIGLRTQSAPFFVVVAHVIHTLEAHK